MAGLIDTSISFGGQNFLFVDEITSDGTYDYVSSMTKKGSILIARYPKDGSAGRYWLGSGVYSTIIAARATYTYLLPNQLEFPKA
jgi:N-methylhydantoinase B/oxoprolinase/acetone carboxylase alpha subunit